MSEGTRGQQGNENYSLSDSNSTTVENDKSPMGPLATLLDLDILPSLVSDTTTLASGDGEGYSGQEEGGSGEAGRGSASRGFLGQYWLSPEVGEGRKGS